MAFSMNNGGFGRRNGRSSGALAEINIVPLVDVVLVLLVIFMLTAHVMEFGLEVEVPRIKSGNDSTQELPVATLDRQGNLSLNEKKVNIYEIGPEIKRRFPGATAVYLRADRHTIYEPIAQVVDVLGRAGMNVRLVTQPEDSGPAK